MGGPIWADQIHDPAFVQGMLDMVDEEKDR
jgi:tRNA G26 N,N-dimethylase Trm1